MNLIGRVISHFRDSSFDGDREDERIGKIDEGALCILRKLNDEGKEAYVVGGCVRDLLMGLVPHDWDITTSARPDEIVSIAKSAGWKAVDGGGRRFGTVIVVREG